PAPSPLILAPPFFFYFLRHLRNLPSFPTRRSSDLNILFANVKVYRVTRSYEPHPAGMRVYNSSDIRIRNVRVNAEHGYGIIDANGPGTFLRAGRFPYDSALQNVTHGIEVRERDFAVFDVVADPPAPKPGDASEVV